VVDIADRHFERQPANAECAQETVRQLMCTFSSRRKLSVWISRVETLLLLTSRNYEPVDCRGSDTRWFDLPERLRVYGKTEACEWTPTIER
jgi:hypothetical protein